MRLRAAFLAMTLIGTAVAGQAHASVTCQPTSGSIARVGTIATNAVRKASGLPALTAHPALNQAAARHACDMARSGRMSHRGSGTNGPAARVKAAGYAPSRTAENIAAGPFTVSGVLQAWVNSRGHRKNITMRQARHFGLGSAIGADGRTVYWAAVYAAPR
ncbi:CAP domain-containing protein [Paracoccus sp. TK19116]|uniref:CAP domain-containing protein n=1 Tax=Paracoccus albicereus TaxID=2922394 RepID=A0ABT1MRU2_9RHOB|nr:CAP domain-containing protein [Paracoccus albicereus]MCQ0970869.1 CAP domain-containing protein [Paracoccus albicereus]